MSELPFSFQSARKRTIAWLDAFCTVIAPAQGVCGINRPSSPPLINPE
jgi:hypothetical protein